MGCTTNYNTKQEDPKKEKLKRRVVQATNSDIRKNYEFIAMLGNGAFGKVRLYRDRTYKDLMFAIKTLKKVDIPSYQFALLKSEVAILSDLDHPNIVKYFGTFEDDYYIHIVMEYLKGHDLYKIISIKNYTNIDEKEMCKIIFQLLKALAFIHSKNIVHRDIKPENILFSDKFDYSSLKLIDFGLATNKKDKKSVGTPYYMAPEVIEGNAYPESDIWSVGVIVHLMLTGKFPFDSKEHNIFDLIKRKKFNTKYLDASECSEEAKNFVISCLKKKYKERPNSQELLNHAWIQKFCNKNDSNMINVETIGTLLDFANKNALQKEIYYFIAKISDDNDILKLKNFFNKIDVDNSGTITIEEIEKAFSEIGIEITDEEIKQIWEGLDFHKDGEVNYSEFLAAMVSSYDFQKEEKLWSVFNLFKESNNKKQDYITYEGLSKKIKALNLIVNEDEIKKCFEKYDEELKFEDFKKMIMESDQEDKKFKLSFKKSPTLSGSRGETQRGSYKNVSFKK